MDELIAEFPWHSVRTANEICRVQVKDGKYGPKVHIRAYANNEPKTRWFTFRPDELPLIIDALDKAQARLRDT